RALGLEAYIPAGPPGGIAPAPGSAAAQQALKEQVAKMTPEQRAELESLEADSEVYEAEGRRR
ncbi:MAG: hypothetical protein ACHQ5A_13865, partial [Opitutales bacterium]